ncbi:MAG: PorT family protein [Cytophagales bacterium]|nr:PorT family protein [Cytophagales bacterium]
MKKLLTFTVLSICLLAFSQKTYAQDTSWGPMAGINGSTITGDFPLNTYKPGVTLGAFLNHSTRERTGLKVEALYSQMGTNFDGFQDKIEMHYFQVPVYGVWYLNDRGNDFRPKLMIGPYIGILVKGSGSNTSDNTFTTENFNSVDFGGKAAAGFNWKVSPNIWLNSELFIGSSFANIYKTDIVNIKNQNFGLNMGLSFPLN